MPKTSLITLCAVLSAVGLLIACGPSGRVKTDDEGTLVGSRKAGVEVFNALVQENTNKLLDAQAPRSRERGKMTIAFIDMENASREELGDAREATYDMVQSILVGSDVFSLLSKRYVDAAMREAGITRPDALFTQNGLDSFMTVLRRDGRAPDYLLWGKFSSLASESEGQDEVNYLLTFELVDAETGETIDSKTSRQRKEYDR